MRLFSDHKFKKKLLSRESLLWFWGGLFLLGWVVFVNLFPEDYIIVGGDVLQPINLSEKYFLYHYEWLGRTSLFYGIFYILDTFGVTNTEQLSWYLGIFLFCSYLSFYAFSKLVFPRAKSLTVILVALFYATNVYTLYVFTSTWGFTHYQILYVFIPVLTGLYIRVLQEKDRKFCFYFLGMVFVASMSFGNPAFALSLGIYFFLLTIALFLFRIAYLNRENLKKVLLLSIGAFLLNVYWILPLLPQVRSGVEEVSSSSVIVLSEALQKTSNAIFDTLRLLQTHESELYYPQNFPYPSFAWLGHAVAFLAFTPFFVVLISLFLKNQERDRRLQLAFFSFFVIFVMLVAKVRFPFDGLNAFLFQLPGLNVLRGYDKLAIYTPFLLSALLLIFLITQQKNRYFRQIAFLFFCVTALLALPFYLGGIQTKLSYALSREREKDFQEADYSALVKIPEPYYSIRKIFDQNSDDGKISRLPFSPGSSVGRANFPDWRVNGPDPAHYLYPKQYVEPNVPYFSSWNFGEDFEKSNYDPHWIINLYGLIGVKYIIYHKDAKPSSVEKMEQAREYLQTKNIISPLTNNKWFTLYEIDEKYVLPYVYTSSGNISVTSQVFGFSERVGNIRSRAQALSYRWWKNPKDITVKLNSPIIGSDLVLNEKYDPLWKAEYISPEGARTVLERDNGVRYANAWKVPENFSADEIIVYYGPIRLLHIGSIASGVTLVMVFFGMIYYWRKRA